MDQPTTPAARSHSRTFSFRSDKSGGSKQKLDLTESPKDKQRRDSIWKNNSKANPNFAISEAQPGAAALLESTTLQPLRGIDHRDANGNAIADPDLSNPTRPRLERPLDTIRSFEKAIDAGYKRRSTHRSESYEQNTQYASRQGSYAGGYDNAPSPARYSQNGGGYYGSRQEGYNGPPRMRHNNRMQSENAVYNSRPYPQHGYHQSQNTMNTEMTSGSDSTGPWATHTDPSSENSSMDKLQSPNKADSGYVANGYGGPNNFDGPIMEEQGSGSYGGAYPPQHRGYNQGMGAPPVQPPQQQRRPMPLGNSTGAQRGQLPSNSRPEPEKRKSWLTRRFSRKA